MQAEIKIDFDKDPPRYEVSDPIRIQLEWTSDRNQVGIMIRFLGPRGGDIKPREDEGVIGWFGHRIISPIPLLERPLIVPGYGKREHVWSGRDLAIHNNYRHAVLTPVKMPRGNYLVLATLVEPDHVPDYGFVPPGGEARPSGVIACCSPRTVTIGGA